MRQSGQQSILDCGEQALRLASGWTGQDLLGIYMSADHRQSTGLDLTRGSLLWRMR